MYWSAVSLVLAAAAPHTSRQLDPKDERVWKLVDPSVVFLMEGENPRGVAALIDRSGLFLAHRGSVGGGQVLGRSSSGETVNLSLKASDSLTGLVLLQAKDWKKGVRPLLPATQDPKPNQGLVAVLPSGPIRAEYVTGDRVGVDSETRRLLPLSEIRFEARSETVGGALLVNRQGKIVGFLSATLEQSPPDNNLSGSDELPAGLGLTQERRFGPGEMMVAYSIAPDVIRRVVQGFRKPPYQTEHPSLGVFCRNAPKKGALVAKVQAGSPAQTYGMRVNDVILEMAGQPIRNQLDFARVMMRQKVGSKLKIKLKRGGTDVLLTAVVGKQKG